MRVIRKSPTHILKPNYRGNPRQYNFSIDFPVNSCELRALKYLTSGFLNEFSVKTELVADIDDSIDRILNMSFISIGGPDSNYKTEDLLSNDENIFLTMDNKKIFSKNDKKVLVENSPGVDYGLILRIRPKEFPDRVWLVCAGFGEWGTSGAAWFLSNKYSELLKEIRGCCNFYYWGKGKNFAAIIRVKNRQDESADLIKVFKSPEDINNFTNEQPSGSSKKADFPTLDADSEPTRSSAIDILPSGIEQDTSYMSGTSVNHLTLTPVNTLSTDNSDADQKKDSKKT